MNAQGLPARIGYAAVALPAGGAAGFYASMFLLPRLTARLPQLDPEMDGGGIFRLAICVGAVAAFVFTLFALTLPWIRHRKRSGRSMRIVASCVFVVLATLAFSIETYSLPYAVIWGLAFAALLTYAVAFTFVRYGIIDSRRRRTYSTQESRQE
jgi:cyanate permease